MRTDRRTSELLARTLVAGLAAAAALAVFVPIISHATPFWTPADFERSRAEDAAAAALAGTDRPPEAALGKLPAQNAPQTHIDYLDLFGDAAAFVASFQVSDTTSPDYGGIREGEHLPNVIQTDNTSESVWLFTRYYELTGDTTYHQNLRASFAYSLAFPAYSEEGGSLAANGYYRMYNCGWACFAEWTYRSVTGDTTYKAYGDSCASYIATHNLNRQGGTFDQYVNPPVLAWAAGNLWSVANAQGNAGWRDAAEARGLRVRDWVNGEPTLLSNETWAMSGGATMWGVIHSWFAENPESLTIWTDARKDSMDAYALPFAAFTTAWNGWYAFGHLAVWQSLQYDAARLRSLALADTIAAEDGDFDGGVPARPADADTMDQTWVTSYLAHMGLDPWIALTSVPPGPVAPESGARAVLRVSASPNPFSAATILRFAMPRAGRATLDVFDIEGRIVRRLVDGSLDAREHDVRWDGRDAAGRATAPGVYVLRLVTPDGSAAAKTVRLR